MMINLQLSKHIFIFNWCPNFTSSQPTMPLNVVFEIPQIVRPPKHHPIILLVKQRSSFVLLLNSSSQKTVICAKLLHHNIQKQYVFVRLNLWYVTCSKTVHPRTFSGGFLLTDFMRYSTTA